MRFRGPPPAGSMWQKLHSFSSSVANSGRASDAPAEAIATPAMSVSSSIDF